MKILVLNYEFPPLGGGASPVSYDICKYLVQRGHRVVVITMGYKDLEKHEIIDGIEIYRLTCIRSKVNVCHPWEQLSYIISAVIFLKKHLKQNEYDVNHTHFIIPTGVISKWLKKKYGIPYVITAHGSDVLGHNNKRFRWLYSLLKNPWCSIVRNAKVVVAPSEYLKDLMTRSEKSANYVVIPNGIDTDLFKPLEKKPYLLVMSRLQETKAVDVIIRALARVELEDWKLVIAGDGPQRTNLEELIKSLQLENKVVFKGWIKGRSKEHLELLGHAAIFVSASRVENCPTSILEALSARCKVVASNIDAHCQMLEKNGRLFVKDDVEELAKILQEEMTLEKSNDIDLKNWKWESIIDKYEESLIHLI